MSLLVGWQTWKQLMFLLSRTLSWCGVGPAVLWPLLSRDDYRYQLHGSVLLHLFENIARDTPIRKMNVCHFCDFASDTPMFTSAWKAFQLIYIEPFEEGRCHSVRDIIEILGPNLCKSQLPVVRFEHVRTILYSTQSQEFKSEVSLWRRLKIVGFTDTETGFIVYFWLVMTVTNLVH